MAAPRIRYSRRGDCLLSVWVAATASPPDTAETAIAADAAVRSRDD